MASHQCAPAYVPEDCKLFEILKRQCEEVLDQKSYEKLQSQTFSAKIAQMSLLVGVVPLMYSEIGCPRESFLAEPTLVGFDPHVSSHMNNEVVVPDEAKSTFYNLKNVTTI